MTCTPRVWGDVLRRLQEEIPDFAYDAWIAPLAVKLARDRVIVGCPTSFHRDRVRVHFAERLDRCFEAAMNASGHSLPARIEGARSIQIVTAPEFAEAPGHSIEVELESARAVLLEVDAAQATRATAGVAQQIAAASASTGPHPHAYTREVASADRSGSSPAANAALEPDSFVLRAVPQADRATRRVAPARRAAHPRHAAVETSPAADPIAADSNVATEQTAASGMRGRDRLPAQAELPFSFESFVVGPCNALAREAALALARERQRGLSQLYLGGESGMGKTHLARATAAEARRYGSASVPAGPGTSRGVVYTSADQFTSEFVSAMRNGRSEEFKRRFRGPIGLLVVEDVQLFSGRAKTQLELFHTMQHVLDAGGRVLLTGDRPPGALTGLDDRMRAQMSGGFVAELEAPDALVRRHILRSKAAAGGVRLPAECLDLLVEATAGSVRDIESVLIQVVTTASLLGRSIDLDLTQEAIALKATASPRLAPRTLAVSEIVRIVAAFFGKRPETLASRSRRRDVLVPRQLAMYLAHRYSDASLSEIGRTLGRDHPSVRNAIQRIERQVLENAPIRYQVEGLSERIDQTLKQRAEDAGA